MPRETICAAIDKAVDPSTPAEEARASWHFAIDSLTANVKHVCNVRGIDPEILTLATLVQWLPSHMRDALASHFTSSGSAGE